MNTKRNRERKRMNEEVSGNADTTGGGDGIVINTGW